jgi:hypothetical protein
MRYTLITAFVFSTAFVSAQHSRQEIDTSNYHRFFSPRNLKGTRITTDFLRLNDVVPIMMEELKNAGYEWLYDRTIYKLQNGQHINISAYSRKSNLGFLYIEGHGIFPSKNDRKILFQKDNSHVNYVECEETFSGEADFVRIERIPSNILVLKEDCYFFQYTDNPEDDKFLVTRAVAEKILRQDLRAYLARAPKPKRDR